MRRIKRGASLVLLLTLLILPMNVFAGTEGVVKEKGKKSMNLKIKMKA